MAAAVVRGFLVVSAAEGEDGEVEVAASFWAFASYQPRLASMDSQLCPRTRTPPMASAARDSGPRLTFTSGVISETTSSQYPGSPKLALTIVLPAGIILWPMAPLWRGNAMEAERVGAWTRARAGAMPTAAAMPAIVSVEVQFGRARAVRR